jgi:hypothetical protein
MAVSAFPFSARYVPHKVYAELNIVFAHPVIARIRATTVNPSLDRTQLLGIAPVDDPESVLIACARRVSHPCTDMGSD